MPSKHHYNLPDEAELVIVEHLLSKDKDKSLNHFKHKINFKLLDSKGKELTDSTVRSRLEHLRNLSKNNRTEFLQHCCEVQLRNKGKLHIDLETEFLQGGSFTTEELEKKEEQTEQAPQDTPKKRKMTADPALKKVKLEHHKDVHAFIMEQGLPADSPVITYKGTVLPGEGNVPILPAYNNLPGHTGEHGGVTKWSGFLICFPTQTPELMENEHIAILDAKLHHGRYVVISSCAVPYGIFLDTKKFKDGLPDFVGDVLTNASHKFMTIIKKDAKKPLIKHTIIDFGNIPLSVSVLAQGRESDGLPMVLRQYENGTKEIAESANFDCPVEHWSLWYIARTDMDYTTSGELNDPEKPKTPRSLAAQLINASVQTSTPKSTPSSSQNNGPPPAAPPPPPPCPPPPVPDILHPTSRPSSLTTVDQSSKGKGKVIKGKVKTKSKIKRNDTEDIIKDWDKTAEKIRKEVEQELSKKYSGPYFTKAELAQEVMKRCDKAHEDSKQSLRRSSIDKLHEVGGDGDTAMGSETSHMKRKAESQENEDSMFRPRNLLTKSLNAVRKGLSGEK